MLLNKWDPRFFKFLLVGGLNTVFGYALFSLFIFLHLHYSLASLFSTILGVAFNFKTTGSLVFKSKENKLIIRFIGVYVIVYLLNVSLLKCSQWLHLNLYLSGAILILPLAVVSFLLNRRYVFGLNQ